MMRSDRGFTRWPVTLVHTCISWHYAQGFVLEDVSSRYVCTTNEIHFWGYYSIFGPTLSLCSSLSPTYEDVYCPNSICFQWETCVKGFILCLENLFGSEFPESKSWGMSACCSACFKSVCVTCQSASFQGNSSSNRVSAVLSTVVLCFVCPSHTGRTPDKKSLNLMSVKWVKHSKAQKVTVSCGLLFLPQITLLGVKWVWTWDHSGKMTEMQLKMTLISGSDQY